jgi:hypothetical protein
MRNKLNIFDLDGTVIDSSHRRQYNADGTLNLNAWRACSRETIMRDSLLPLASVMRELIASNKMVAICTSRVLNETDWEYLEMHQILPRIIISRIEGDTTPDAEFKTRELKWSFNALTLRQSQMWEDMPEIRASVSKLGILAIDPIPFNKVLA